MELTDWITAGSSLVAILISLAAMWQTHRQIVLGNKHQLFDRRLDKYLLLHGLLDLYKQNSHLFEHKDEVIGVPEFVGTWLTNCVQLESMQSCLDTPFEKDKKKAFLTKIEMLNQAAIEIELIWSNEYGKMAASFILYYSYVFKHYMLRGYST